MRRLLLLCSVTLACASDPSSAGTGGTEGDSGETGMTDPTLPAEPTAEAIAAFIAAETYKGAGWQAETDAPREESTTSSPHDRVRVYLHDTTVAAHAMDLGFVGGDPLPVGSAAVKEFYDEMDQHLGTAMMLRHAEGLGMDATTYWCVGPTGRCSTGSPEYADAEPLFGDGNTTACGGCHTGLIFTKLQ